MTNVYPRYSEPYGYGNVMVARAEGSELQFKNLVGWIKIRLQGDITVKSLTLYSHNTSDVVSGTGYVTIDDQGNPVFDPGPSDTYNYSSIDFDGASKDPARLSPDSPTDFYFPVLPGTLADGFYVDGSSSIGEIYFETTNSVTVERNKVTPMAVKIITGPKAVLLEGPSLNAQLKSLSGSDNPNTNTANSNIKAVVFDTYSSVSSGTEVQASDSEAKIYANLDETTGTMTLSTPSGQIWANANSSYMFCALQGLETIDINDINVSEVTDASSMFRLCSKLTSIGDISLPLATTTDDMFFNCPKLEGVGDVSIPEVTSAVEMFDLCSKLSRLGSITTTKLQNAQTMFGTCNSLSGVLDLSGMQGNLTNVQSMFYNCNQLTGITFSSGFNTAAVTSTQAMFRWCSSLTSLDLSGFDFGNVTNMSYMFERCNNLSNIVWKSGFTTSKVSNMSYMFCNNPITAPNYDILDFTSATTTQRMFDSCSSLTGVDFSSKNAPVLANASGMFYNCSGMTSVKMPVTTTALKDVSALFYGTGITSFAPSSFPARPTTVANMFAYCTSLTSVNLPSDFNTTDCNSYVAFFSNCTKLTSIYLKGMVIKGSGTEGLGTGTDYYAKFANSFAGVGINPGYAIGCKVHCIPYNSSLGNSNPYNAFGTTNSSYTQGTRPTFDETSNHDATAPMGTVLFCDHSEYINDL